MIDTHCHLTDPRIFSQLDAVLQRAADAGVSRLVTIATHPEDWTAALTLAEKHEHIRVAIGVHPNNCDSVELSDVDQLRTLQLHPRVVALGEMGLDYHYGLKFTDRQKLFLEKQLSLAAELSRPVVIHCREAAADCLAMLANFPTVQSVFHCFTGTADEAEQILAAGHLIGFTGVVTFRNAPELRAIAAAMPADRILVETDAPYLTPEPMRKQKINEPAMVVHTAAAVAQARGLTLQELDELSTANALRFYQWK